MTFNKQDQKMRALQFAEQAEANGAKVPVPQVVPVSKTEKKSCGNCAKCKCDTKPKSKRRLKPYFAETFKNNIGQEVNVGDQVVVVATGYSHSVKVRKGVYMGFRKDQRGRTSSVVVLAEMAVPAWYKNGKKLTRWISGAEHRMELAQKVSAYPSLRVYKIA